MNIGDRVQFLPDWCPSGFKGRTGTVQAVGVVRSLILFDATPNQLAEKVECYDIYLAVVNPSDGSLCDDVQPSFVAGGATA